ncbi:MAG TPA: hypothetical protein DCE23_08070, partial [Firmicutes bacterium]|nr:hypothetical protein [Bacillota bacterium]
NLSKYINKKFDLIFLSNISDYAKNFFKGDYLKEYFSFIKNDITKLLTDNGLIQSAYIYDYGDDKEVRSDINIDKRRKEVITKEFEIKIIPSTIGYLRNDAIIIHKGGINNGE